MQCFVIMYSTIAHVHVVSIFAASGLRLPERVRASQHRKALRRHMGKFRDEMYGKSHARSLYSAGYITRQDWEYVTTASLAFGRTKGNERLLGILYSANAVTIARFVDFELCSLGNRDAIVTMFTCPGGKKCRVADDEFHQYSFPLQNTLVM